MKKDILLRGDVAMTGTVEVVIRVDADTDIAAMDVKALLLSAIDRGLADQIVTGRQILDTDEAVAAPAGLNAMAWLDKHERLMPT